MSRVIVITSGKGGVGKTTITANLGIALAQKGYSVCLVDADIGLNNLDVVLNVENKVVYDIIDCLENKCRVTQALIEMPLIENLFVLPSSKSLEKIKINLSDYNNIIQKLKTNFDFVLIDCPAGIEKGFDLAVACATEAMVVVTPHISSVKDADRVVTILASYKIENVTLVVNRIRGDLVARKEMLSAYEIEKLMNIKLVGVVPDSDDIGLYNSYIFKNEINLAVKNSFNVLAKNIINERYEQYDYLSKYKGLLGMIRRNIKRKA